MSFYKAKPWLKTKEDYYNTKRFDFKGRSFHSQSEAALYSYLLTLEAQNEIKDLQCQVHVHVGPEGIIKAEKQLMIPDFSAIHLDKNELIFHEFKGYEDEKWKYKRKMWLWHGPAKMLIYKGSAKSFKVVETLIPFGLR